MADTGDLKSPAQSRAYGFESRPWHQLRRHLMQVEIEISGSIPRGIGLGRAELRAAAEFFAERSSSRVGVPFRAVAVVLQDDASSAEVHKAINGAEGATDVVTQRYDAIPGEEPGVYGELYVNCERAVAAAPRRRGWNAAKELLLYVAHGMDHLSGADDLDERGYRAMRRRELRWIYFFSNPPRSRKFLV